MEVSGSSIPYTVVIPAFKAKDYISRAYHSVRNQTVQPSQIIIVDDYSPDGTAEFIEKHLPSVTLVRQSRNQGAAAARNLGLERCTTPIVMFMDADDQWLPRKSESQIAIFRDAPDVDGVFCDFNIVTMDGLPEGWQGGLLNQMVQYGLNPTKLGKSGYKINGDFMSALITHGGMIHPSGVSFRTDKLKEVGGFNCNYNGIADHELWIRFTNKYRMGYVDEILLRVEGRPDSLGRRRILMGEELVRFYKSLFHDYPEVAARNKDVIHRHLRTRLLYLSTCFVQEEKNLGKAFPNFFESLSYGITRDTISTLKDLAIDVITLPFRK